MTARRPLAPRNPLTLLCALVAAVGLAACSVSHHPHTASGESNGQNSADANNNGAYVFAGNVTYQLQISRELNQYSVEDSQYVRGVPAGTPSPGPHQLWYGVFLYALNQSDSPQTVSDNFEIIDTQGSVYRPFKLDPNVNPFAWRAVTLKPLQTVPEPNTIMSDGPTQGGLLLFKINTSAYDNRPLVLFILNNSNQKLAAISLNL